MPSKHSAPVLQEERIMREFLYVLASVMTVLVIVLLLYGFFV